MNSAEPSPSPGLSDREILRAVPSHREVGGSFAWGSS